MTHTTQTCGYQGHTCGREVQFISRYRDQSDYCVSGQRISVYDDGSTSDRATPDQLQAIRLFLLNRYAEYITWRADMKQKHGGDWGPLQPIASLPEVAQ